VEFFKTSCLIAITVDFCLKTTFYTSQRSAETIVGEMDKFIIIHCQYHQDNVYQKLLKLVDLLWS